MSVLTFDCLFLVAWKMFLQREMRINNFKRATPAARRWWKTQLFHFSNLAKDRVIGIAIPLLSNQAWRGVECISQDAIQLTGTSGEKMKVIVLVFWDPKVMYEMEKYENRHQIFYASHGNTIRHLRLSTVKLHSFTFCMFWWSGVQIASYFVAYHYAHAGRR